MTDSELLDNARDTLTELTDAASAMASYERAVKDRSTTDNKQTREELSHYWKEACGKWVDFGLRHGSALLMRATPPPVTTSPLVIVTKGGVHS